MSISVDSLISDVRRDSGLRNNPLFSDDDIARILSDSYSDLVDRFIASHANWLSKKFRFTLAGGNEGNFLDLSEIPDFERDQWLNRSPDSTPPETVDKLPSQMNRNNGGILGPCSRRTYDAFGDRLEVYPPSNSAGYYELAYLPMAPRFAVPTTPPARTVSLIGGSVSTSGRWIFPAAGTFTESDSGASFTVTGAVNAGNNGTHVITLVESDTTVHTSTAGLVNENPFVSASSSIQQTGISSRTFDIQAADIIIPTGKLASFSGASFTQSDRGAVITVEFDDPNKSFNGEYEIVAVNSSSSVFVSSDKTGSSSTNPAAGTVSLDRRQPGTVAKLESKFTPWAKYMTTLACIAIRNERGQSVVDFERTLAQQLSRLLGMAKTRSQGIRQAPITKNRRHW